MKGNFHVAVSSGNSHDGDGIFRTSFTSHGQPHSAEGTRHTVFAATEIKKI